MIKAFSISLCFLSINFCSCKNNIDEAKIEQAIKDNHKSKHIIELEINGEYFGDTASISSTGVRNVFYIDTIKNELLTVLYFSDSPHFLTTYHFINNKLSKTAGEAFAKNGSQNLQDLFYFSSADNNIDLSNEKENNPKFKLLKNAKQYLKILDNYKSLQ